MKSTAKLGVERPFCAEFVSTALCRLVNASPPPRAFSSRSKRFVQPPPGRGASRFHEPLQIRCLSSLAFTQSCHALLQPIAGQGSFLPKLKIIRAKEQVVFVHRRASCFNHRTAQPTRAASNSFPSRTKVWKSSIRASADGPRPALKQRYLSLRFNHADEKCRWESVRPRSRKWW